jgi:hypothetical protein
MRLISTLLVVAALGSGTSFASATDIDHDYESPRGILRHTAALVEVRVTNISTSYDEQIGPRTNVEMEVAAVHLGKLADSKLTISMYGGPEPDGYRVWTSEDVHFVAGGVYLLFLGNEGWFYSPFVGGARNVLRVDRALGQEVLADRTGYVVSSVDPTGIHHGVRAFVEDTTSAEEGVAKLRAEPALAHELNAESLKKTLSKAQFITALRAAARAEKVDPSGTLAPAPMKRANWRDTPVSPAAVPAK